ncbi:hypothetical protein Y032_0011g1425 [Ancylostoma ceylanicum]|uniref:Uncharacterized protein n=1 Tax=Ancylostoma ceylanicum TaxID=53326 RepID=A0A016VEK0_9BILA|nr:hypothetical protein Y032_0011g1425 [Ancylostoma ceylanicum]
MWKLFSLSRRSLLKGYLYRRLVLVCKVQATTTTYSRYIVDTAVLSASVGSLWQFPLSKSKCGFVLSILSHSTKLYKDVQLVSPASFHRIQRLPIFDLGIFYAQTY